MAKKREKTDSLWSITDIQAAYRFIEANGEVIANKTYPFAQVASIKLRIRRAQKKGIEGTGNLF